MTRPPRRRPRSDASAPDPHPAAPPSGETGTARVEAFSDGVFAIAITLLVLELRVVPADVSRAGGLAGALLAEWPSYVGYAISFLILGIMWANHHHIFRYIDRADSAFVMLNVLLLFFVAFIPFPTAVLAHYLPEPAERRTAVLFYSGVFTVTAVTYNAVWLYAARGRRLIASTADDATIRAITRRFLMGPTLYLVATLAALVSTTLSLAILGGLALLNIVPLAWEARNAREPRGSPPDHESRRPASASRSAR